MSMKGLLLVDLESALLTGSVKGTRHCGSRDLAFNHIVDRFAAAVRPVQFHFDGVCFRIERSLRELKGCAIRIHCAMQSRAVPLQFDSDLRLTRRAWAPFPDPGST